MFDTVQIGTVVIGEGIDEAPMRIGEKVGRRSEVDVAVDPLKAQTWQPGVAHQLLSRHCA